MEPQKFNSIVPVAQTGIGAQITPLMPNMVSGN